MSLSFDFAREALAILRQRLILLVFPGIALAILVLGSIFIVPSVLNAIAAESTTSAAAQATAAAQQAQAIQEAQAHQAAQAAQSGQGVPGAATTSTDQPLPQTGVAPLASTATPSAHTSPEGASELVLPLIPSVIVGGILLVLMQMCIAAMLWCVIQTIRGNEDQSGLGYGIGAALTRSPFIAMWALAAFVIGGIVNAVADAIQPNRMGSIGGMGRREAARILRGTWEAYNLFTLAAIVVDGDTPWAAFKRARTITQSTWGQTIVGTYAVGLVTFIIMIPGGLIAGYIGWQVSGAGTVSGGQVTLALVGVTLALAGYLFVHTLHKIYGAILYEHGRLQNDDEWARENTELGRTLKRIEDQQKIQMESVSRSVNGHIPTFSGIAGAGTDALQWQIDIPEGGDYNLQVTGDAPMQIAVGTSGVWNRNEILPRGSQVMPVTLNAGPWTIYFAPAGEGAQPVQVSASLESAVVDSHLPSAWRLAG